MRNLKRALSLVMAAAMLIGMMAVSASAADNYEDFTDKDEIQNSEAVATMVSLGVFNGKEDGSYFDPTGIVTRAEMAKIIAVSLNGGKDLVIGSGASTTQFSDTKGNWAEAYIAYCANLGIINGKGDGTFGPNEPVTGTAAAKMVLCALGYRSDIEGFTGAGWDLNTDTKAMEIGLYDDMSGMIPSNGLSRDNTAQLIFNGVQADEVVYRNNYGEYSGVIYAQPKYSNQDSSMLALRFGVVKVTGVVMANDEFALGDYNVQKEGKTYIMPSLLPDAVSFGADGSYNVSVPTDLIGQTVVIYVKGKTAINPNPATAEVLGTAIVSDLNTVATSTKKFTADAWTKFLRDSDLRGDPGEIYDNYSTLTTETLAAGSTGNGFEMTYIDNDGDGTIDVVIRLKPVLSKVTSYNATKELFNLAGINKNIEFVDATGYEDLARGDMVMYLLANGTYHISDVKTMDGGVTRYRVTDGTDKFYTVDGDQYGESALASASMSNPTVTADMVADDTILSGTYRFYMDANNTIIAYEVIDEPEGDFVIVLESGIVNNDALTSDPVGKVKVLFPDATTATYTLNMKDSAYRYDGYSLGTNAGEIDDVDSFAQTIAQAAQYGTGQGDDAIKNTIVRLSVAEDGTATIAPTLMDVAWGNGAGAIAKGAVRYTIDDAQMTKQGSDQTIILNNNTKFVFAYGSPVKYTAITGSGNLASAGIAADKVYAAAWNKNTSVAEVVFVQAEPGTLMSSYAYITSKPNGERDGNTYYYYSEGFTTNGDPITLKFNAPTNFKDTVVRYSVDNKGVASISAGSLNVNGTPTNSAASFEYVKGVITSVNNNVIGVTYGGTEYAFDVTGVTAYDVSGDAAVETDYAVDQSIVLSTKLENNQVIIGGAFVLEQVATNYDVVLNGVVVDSAAMGKTVTVTIPTVAAAAATDVVVTGTTTGITYDSTTQVTFVMEDEPVNVTTKHVVTSAAATLANADGTTISSGDKVAYGTVVTVTASAVDKAVTSSDVTLTEVTTPNGSTAGVYTFEMPAKAVTLTQAS